MYRIAVVVVMLGYAPTLLSQAPPRLAFDVASVKPSGDPRSGVFAPVVAQVRPGGIWRSTFATLHGMIRACRTAARPWKYW